MGGIVVPVSVEFWPSRQAHTWRVRHLGRIAALARLDDQWVHIAAVHINPAWPMSCQKPAPRRLGDATCRNAGHELVLGDWSFVVSGDPQFDSWQKYREPHQHEFTWRRIPREAGSKLISSRLDRIYLTSTPIR